MASKGLGGDEDLLLPDPVSLPHGETLSLDMVSLVCALSNLRGWRAETPADQGVTKYTGWNPCGKAQHPGWGVQGGERQIPGPFSSQNQGNKL